jgi:tryptophanyl-tRNA synthetase
VQNLVTLYSAMSGEKIEAILNKFGGGNFAPFKEGLADVAVAAIAPIATRFNDLLQDRAEIDRILAEGADRARAISGPIMKDVYRTMGFWQR